MTQRDLNCKARVFQKIIKRIQQLYWSLGIKNEKKQMPPRRLSTLTCGFEFCRQPIKIIKKSYFFLKNFFLKIPTLFYATF